MERTSHHCYNPDIGPRNFCLFRLLMEQTRSQKLNTVSRLGDVFFFFGEGYRNFCASEFVKLVQ
jgi:hypothetical protein